MRETIAPGDKLDGALLAKYGLGDVLSDVRRVPDECVAIGVQRGPEGESGVILAPVSHGGSPDVTGYRPDCQQWRPNGSGAWIGHDGNLRSIDLMRRRIRLGYFLTSDDGQSWLIPIARSPSPERETLPAYVVWNGDGRASKRIKTRYVALWELAGQYAAYLVGRESPAESEEWRINAAVEALMVNYRIGRSELTILAEMEISPLDTQTVDVILKSLVDEPLVMDAKKNATTANSRLIPPTVATKHGNADASEITDQAGVN